MGGRVTGISAGSVCAAGQTPDITLVHAKAKARTPQRFFPTPPGDVLLHDNFDPFPATTAQGAWQFAESMAASVDASS
jgi:hypothetical protein